MAGGSTRSVPPRYQWNIIEQNHASGTSIGTSSGTLCRHTPEVCYRAAKRVEVCVAKVVHPCRVKSFESHIVRGYVMILEKVLANKSQITYT